MSVLLSVSAQATSDGRQGEFPHVPETALDRLDSRMATLPAAAFHFDLITNGSRRYPEHMRYRTITGISLCQCRLRCLAERRCLGFEHEADGDTCGLTDVLLPSDVTNGTGGRVWSTGRRRGISWLGQSCHVHQDCSLFVSDPEGVVCGFDKICRCRDGWTQRDELNCRPGNLTDQKPMITTGRPVENTEQTTEKSAEQNTGQTTEHPDGTSPGEISGKVTQQTTVEIIEGESTSKLTTPPRTARPSRLTIAQSNTPITGQTIEQAIRQTTHRPPTPTEKPDGRPPNTTGPIVPLTTGQSTQRPPGRSSQHTTARPIVEPTIVPTAEQDTDPFKELYADISGRLLRLTDRVSGKNAAAKCLEFGGIRYVPDSEDLVGKVIENLRITTPVGVGFNSKLSDDHVLALDGTELSSDSAWWVVGQLTTTLHDCVALDGDGKLHRATCGLGGDMPQLCEYIGPNLLDAATEFQYTHQSIWTVWVFDMGALQQVSSVLFLVGDDTSQLRMTNVFVGDDLKMESGRPCARHEGRLAAAGFSRLLKCVEKITGRYIYVSPQFELTSDPSTPFWSDLAAFGN